MIAKYQAATAAFCSLANNLSLSVMLISPVLFSFLFERGILLVAARQILGDAMGV